MLTGWIYYRSVWGCIVLCPLGFYLYKRMVIEKEEQKKSEFLLQFKEMTDAVAQALYVGYSAENAWKEAQKEMKSLYPGKILIMKELDYIVRKIRLQIPLELVLDEFSQKVDLEDVKNFVHVFSAAKRSGGDMIAIIRNTAAQIGEKIDTKREIDIILASKKYEFKIMCIIPYAMITYMQMSFPEFMSVLYGNIIGIGVMSLCLACYTGAYILGAKMIKITV